MNHLERLINQIYPFRGGAAIQVGLFCSQKMLPNQSKTYPKPILNMPWSCPKSFQNHPRNISERETSKSMTSSCMLTRCQSPEGGKHFMSTVWCIADLMECVDNRSKQICMKGTEPWQRRYSALREPAHMALSSLMCASLSCILCQPISPCVWALYIVKSRRSCTSRLPLFREAPHWWYLVVAESGGPRFQDVVSNQGSRCVSLALDDYWAVQCINCSRAGSSLAISDVWFLAAFQSGPSRKPIGFIHPFE